MCSGRMPSITRHHPTWPSASVLDGFGSGLLALYRTGLTLAGAQRTRGIRPYAPYHARARASRARARWVHVIVRDIEVHRIP